MGKISPVKSDRLPQSDHPYLSARNKAELKVIDANNKDQPLSVSKEELMRILDCITFEPVPGKDAWGKISRDDRQFINGQISEYGKT